MRPGKPHSRTRQIELDDLRRAGADEEEELDLRSPSEQTGYRAIELLVRLVGELVFDDLQLAAGVGIESVDAPVDQRAIGAQR